MRVVINQLIQLQDLLLARDEQVVLKGPGCVKQIDESIGGMTSGLPPDVRSQFERLVKRDRLIVVPVYEEICSACGIRLPTSLVQSVRMAKVVQCCPNCARILYYPESVVRRVGKARRRSDPPVPGISRFSSPRLMIPRLEAEDKNSVIKELAHKMESEGFVDDGAMLADAAFQREDMISTAVDHGLAFPHVRNVEGGGLTLALGISKDGVHFDAADGRLTHICFFMVIPTAASAFYLRLLAGLTETFMRTEARKAVLSSSDSETLWNVLTRITRATVK